jgi:hypothetical protein
MFPAVFLALPLLLPITNRAMETRVDLLTPTPLLTQAPLLPAVDRVSVIETQKNGRIIPPLYRRDDGGLSVSLSPGSPCTAACLKLEGTF